jgi:putative oxidoreductase
MELVKSRVICSVKQNNLINNFKTSKMKNIIFNISKIGKYLYAIPMVIFGLFHFLNASAMAGMVPIPGGVFWIYLTGLSLILAGVSIIIQKLDEWSSFLLAGLLLVFVLTIHLPGVLAGGEMAQMYMTNLLKDIALAGGALTYLNSKKLKM